MNPESGEFLQRLFNSEHTSPAMRASYEAELNAMLHPKLTPRKAWTGIVLLAVLVICTVALIRNMFVYDFGPLTFLTWGVLAAGFSWVSFLIVRDLWRKKHSPKSAISIGHILMTSAGAITAVALLMGLNEPANPASTFNAFFVFVWYFACVTLALDNRIAAAELAAREQMLRIEYRLADLAERLQN